VSVSGAATSILVEVAFLALLYGAVELLCTRFPGAARALTGLHALLTLSGVLVVASHAFFFSSASERRFSALELDFATVLYFFRTVLPLKGHAILLSVLSASGLGALWFAKKPWLSAAAVQRGVGAALAASALVLIAAPRIPSPVVDMAYDAAESLRTRRVTFDARTKAPGPLAALEGASTEVPAFTSRFSRVLVFVMETMTAQKLEKERAALPADSFVNAARAHAHQFTEYFPSNQDSRTGMLGMLSSRFIPYEAYTEGGAITTCS
jgi:hypothetical protein